jgi:hypothetical protein
VPNTRPSSISGRTTKWGSPSHPARSATPPDTSCGRLQPRRSRSRRLPPKPEGRSDIHAPTTDNPEVRAWADDYIRFERRPPWQEQLRTEIRALCETLKPSDEQILHATFFGTKRSNADIENLLLYNIDAFKVAGHNGIRFEHGEGAVPPAPDGTQYPFCYRYALAPRSGTFEHWQRGRTLASFDWIEMGAFTGKKTLAQTWLAVKLAQARGQVEVFEPARAPDQPFAVRVEVRPPHRHQPRWDLLLKGIFDGVISAFQAHTDTTVLPDVAERLATYLPADPAEIAELLLGQQWAVLGVVPRLVYPFRGDVKWDPADHLCVAGELLAAEPVDARWAIKGEIVELSR